MSRFCVHCGNDNRICDCPYGPTVSVEYDDGSTATLTLPTPEEIDRQNEEAEHFIKTLFPGDMLGRIVSGEFDG